MNGVMRASRARKRFGIALVMMACVVPAPLCAQEHGHPPMPFELGPEHESHGFPVRRDRIAAADNGGFTGTSFATAHVTAILARCRADGHMAPQCLDKLIESARNPDTPGRDTIYGYGFVE